MRLRVLLFITIPIIPRVLLVIALLALSTWLLLRLRPKTFWILRILFLVYALIIRIIATVNWFRSICGRFYIVVVLNVLSVTKRLIILGVVLIICWIIVLFLRLSLIWISWGVPSWIAFFITWLLSFSLVTNFFWFHLLIWCCLDWLKLFSILLTELRSLISIILFNFSHWLISNLFKLLNQFGLLKSNFQVFFLKFVDFYSKRG